MQGDELDGNAGEDGDPALDPESDLRWPAAVPAKGPASRDKTVEEPPEVSLDGA